MPARRGTCAARRRDVPYGGTRDTRRARGARDLPGRAVQDMGEAGSDRTLRGISEGRRRHRGATRGDRDDRGGRGGAGGGAGAREPRQDAARGVGTGGRVREREETRMINRLVHAAVVAMVLSLHHPPPSSTILHVFDIHSEYVKYVSGRDTITAYLAYPERKDRAPAVIVIHEIFGMSDFVRQTTEQLARDGFVAIAPDLLSRRGGTPASPDDARKLIASLNADTLTQDLDATVAYVKQLKAVRPDRVGVIGFCWGGGQSFRYATNNPSLRAFVVC